MEALWGFPAKEGRRQAGLTTASVFWGGGLGQAATPTVPSAHLERGEGSWRDRWWLGSQALQGVLPFLSSSGGGGWRGSRPRGCPLPRGTLLRTRALFAAPPRSCIGEGRPPSHLLRLNSPPRVTRRQGLPCPPSFQARGRRVAGNATPAPSLGAAVRGSPARPFPRTGAQSGRLRPASLPPQQRPLGKRRGRGASGAAGPLRRPLLPGRRCPGWCSLLQPQRRAAKGGTGRDH